MTTRYAIASTTPALKVVNVSAHIPDPDCPHSFFDRCRIMGDLSAYDMRDWTLLDCDLTGVSGLPSGDSMEFINSRSTDWPIGIIPDDIHLHNLDLGAAWLRQRAPQLSGQNVAIANHLANYAISNYNLSAINVIYEIKNQFGVPDKATAEVIFDTATEFKAEVGAYEPQPVVPQIPDMTTDLTELHVFSGGPTRLDISGDIIPTKDRWVLARHLESVYPEVRFWVRQIEPSLNLIAHSRIPSFVDEEWWFERINRRLYG